MEKLYGKRREKEEIEQDKNPQIDEIRKKQKREKKRH